MENQTLESVVRSRGRQGRDQTESQNSFNTFLNIYSINLAHRFPDVTDLNRIDSNVVRNIANFSVASSRIALEVWDETSEVQRSSRQERAA